MGAEKKGGVVGERKPEQEDRRELEVLLALAASEAARKRGKPDSEISSQTHLAAKGTSTF
jgi:hypothetical protein